MPWRLDAPVVGWVLGDILPDGSLEAQLGDDWTASDGPVADCHRTEAAIPTLGGGLLVRPIVAAQHLAPAPFCECGFGAAYSLRGRTFDRYRDRLGHRLRCPAIVQLWGRAVLENEGARAERGRVLALVAAEGETTERLRRVELAATRLNCGVLTVDPGTFDRAGLLERERPSTSALLTRSQFSAAARSRRVRRWHSRARDYDTHHWFEASLGLAVLMGGAVGAGAEALGASAALATVAAVPTGVAGVLLALRRRFNRTVSVEAIVAPPPDSEAGVSEAVALTEGRPQPGRLPTGLEA